MTAIRFRWSVLQVSALKALQPIDPDTIKDALNELPDDLNESYARILRRIYKRKVPQAVCALQWLIASKRPLYIEELADACSNSLSMIKQSHDSFLEGTPGPTIFFDMFRDFLIFRPPLPTDPVPGSRQYTVTLAHFSVREFLLQRAEHIPDMEPFALKTRQAHLKVAKDCLVYLYRFNTRHTPREKFPLREYAWFHWEKHVQPSGEDEALTDPARQKATRLYERFRQNSTLVDDPGENDALTDWIPREHKAELLDSLKTPYFYDDFDNYWTQGDMSGRPRWFGEKRPRSDKGDIGLITILPTIDPEAEIRCRIHVRSLLQNSSRPRYKAVSYALGVKVDYPLFVNGYQKSVRPELARIFRNVRSHQEGQQTMFWADVILFEEYQSHRAKFITLGKAYQQDDQTLITLREVFRNAEEVYVSLGEERSKDEDALSLVQRIVFLAQQWRKKTQESSLDDNDDLAPHSGSDLYKAVIEIEENQGWNVLMSIFDRHWWFRRWVIQELVLARSVVMFLGNRAFNFDLLAGFVESEILIKNILQCRYTSLGQGYHEFFDSHQWGVARDLIKTKQEYNDHDPVAPEKLLWRFRFQAAAYRVDTIRSLASVSNCEELFSHDLPEGLYAIAKSLLNPCHDTPNLDFLSFGSVFSALSGVEEAKTRPSWLPAMERDATEVVPLILTFCEDGKVKAPFNACGRLTVDLSFDQELPETNRLLINGFICDRVRKVSDAYLGDPKHSNLLQHAKQMKEIMEDWHNKATSDSTFGVRYSPAKLNPLSLETIWRVLMADQSSRGIRLPNQTLGEATDIPNIVTKELAELLSESAEPALVKALRFLYGRRIFFTEYGRLGIGPYRMRSGDSIVILGGGNVPYVLRKIFSIPGSFEDAWDFIGEWCVHFFSSIRTLPGHRWQDHLQYTSYLDGVMDGELVQSKMASTSIVDSSTGPSDLDGVMSDDRVESEATFLDHDQRHNFQDRTMDSHSEESETSFSDYSESVESELSSQDDDAASTCQIETQTFVLEGEQMKLPEDRPWKRPENGNDAEQAISTMYEYVKEARELIHMSGDRRGVFVALWGWAKLQRSEFSFYRYLRAHESEWAARKAAISPTANDHGECIRCFQQFEVKMEIEKCQSC